LLGTVDEETVPVSHADVFLIPGCDEALGNDTGYNVFHARSSEVWEVIQSYVLRFVEVVSQLVKHETRLLENQFWVCGTELEPHESRAQLILGEVDGAPMVGARALSICESFGTTRIACLNKSKYCMFMYKPRPCRLMSPALSEASKGGI
jgi:hypothetical protein